MNLEDTPFVTYRRRKGRYLEDPYLEEINLDDIDLEDRDMERIGPQTDRGKGTM